MRDSRELLVASIKHLALNGIGDFYLYDHGSDPDLASVLSQEFRSGAIRVHVLRKQTRPFFQRVMVAALAELARVDGFEVAVAFDADEFWCSTVEGKSLAVQVASEMTAGVDALRVPVVNYAQHRDVEAFREDSLLGCRYSVVPHDEASSPPWDQVDAGLPFIAVPFPSKVIARLSPDTRFAEGQHTITKGDGRPRIIDTSGVVVRHLSLPSRDELVGKRAHGLARMAAGHSFGIGWQVQRLAHMTDGELDAYWNNNSWHLSRTHRALVGAYDCLVDDDGLVRVGHELSHAGDCFRMSPGDAADGAAPFGENPSQKLERLVERLVDDVGVAEQSREEQVMARRRSAAEAAGLRARLADSEAESAGLRARLADSEAECAGLRGRLADSEALVAAFEEQLRTVAVSTSWRLTAPLRRAATLVRRGGAQLRVARLVRRVADPAGGRQSILPRTTYDQDLHT